MRNGGRLIMRTKDRMNCIPTEMIKQLGLGENWQNNISNKQQKIANKLAIKFKGALRELSKN